MDEVITFGDILPVVIGLILTYFNTYKGNKQEATEAGEPLIKWIAKHESMLKWAGWFFLTAFIIGVFILLNEENSNWVFEKLSSFFECLAYWAYFAFTLTWVCKIFNMKRGIGKAISLILCSFFLYINIIGLYASIESWLTGKPPVV